MTVSQNIHENFAREEDSPVGSNRAFGIVIAVVFAIIGLWPLVSSHAVRRWPLVVAVLMFAAALLAPGILSPLNRLWHAFGLLLHKVVAPVILVLVFGVFIIVGWIRRGFVKDPLALRFDPSATTYWVDRAHRPDTASLRQQF